MPNISECFNDAAVCLLSHVLETMSVQEKYFFEFEGVPIIIRRAEKRARATAAGGGAGESGEGGEAAA